jgi:RNA polymerase subunit RPABC4/transcription elongation factor Spt4
VAASRTYHRYSLPVIGALAVAEILSWVLIGAGNDVISDIGAFLFLGVLTVAFILDGTGVVTLRGRVFTSLSRGALIVIAVLFFAFFLFWIIPYLIIAALDTLRGVKASPDDRLDHYERIAELEGKLGILPAAEGVCAKCHKPLQLGAEYCAYCGAPVAPALQVCPVCHARTFPDAKWCPECGTALTAGDASQRPAS